MKRLHIIFLAQLTFLSLIASPKAVAQQCLSPAEKVAVQSKIEALKSNDYYGGNNFLSCKNLESGSIEYIACNNQDLKLLFELESKTYTYGFLNATKGYSDISKYNAQYQTYWRDAPASSEGLCYELKKRIVDSLGVESPFLVSGSESSPIFFQTNSHGLVLQTSTRIVYLGKDCDAIDSLGEVGTWRYTDEQYSINLGGSNNKISTPSQIDEARCTEVSFTTTIAKPDNEEANETAVSPEAEFEGGKDEIKAITEAVSRPVPTEQTATTSVAETAKKKGVLTSV